MRNLLPTFAINSLLVWNEPAVADINLPTFKSLGSGPFMVLANIPSRTPEFNGVYQLDLFYYWDWNVRVMDLVTSNSVGLVFWEGFFRQPSEKELAEKLPDFARRLAQHRRKTRIEPWLKPGLVLTVEERKKLPAPRT